MTGLSFFVSNVCRLPFFLHIGAIFFFSTWKQYSCTSGERDCQHCEDKGTFRFVRTKCAHTLWDVFARAAMIVIYTAELSLPKHRTFVPSRSRSALSAWHGIFDGEVRSAECSVKKRGANRMAIIADRKTPQGVRLCLECSIICISSRHEVHSRVWKMWPACPCFLPCFFGAKMAQLLLFFPSFQSSLFAWNQDFAPCVRMGRFFTAEAAENRTFFFEAAIF